MPAKSSALFGWLNTWRADELRGELRGIYIASDAGAPMQALTGCRCEPARGIVGDRYAAGRGHWIKTDGCEVTLIRAEDIARASRHGPVSFLSGEHRRNLVVAGIPLDAYRRSRVRIGEVLFAFHRLRPPCGYLDRLLQPGAGKALGKGAGIGLRVVEGGAMHVGDAVQVIPAASGRDAR